MARILVIDDEKNIRRMVRLTLERPGHEVTTAEDGPAGLEMFGDGEGWDLVLVDQRMPGMEGRTVVAELLARDSRARVIMITSFATPDLASEVVGFGGMDFLRKPFSAEMLRGAVTAALHRPSRAVIDQLSTQEEPETALGSADSGREPLVSHYINGFHYWSVPGETPSPLPDGFEIRRSYRVADADGHTHRCVVAVAPHVRLQIESGAKHERAVDDRVWNAVCRTLLSDYLWEEARIPPALLPVYELTGRQRAAIRDLAGRRVPLID